MSFAIVTDTSANLPSTLLKRYALSVVPFSFHINGSEHIDLDAEEFDAASFFAAMRAGTKVETSQIPPQTYIDCFEPLLSSGQDVLFVGMSSGISGSYNSSVIAAGELRERFPERRLHCIDTYGASLGEGLQVLRACELREAGKTIDETAEAILAERPKMCQIFTVGDLKYLRATGRLSGVATIVGTMLSIKPVLKGNELGQIVLAGKVRGRRQVIENLAARYTADVVSPETQTIGIAHCDCRDDADMLIKLIYQGGKPPKDVLLVDYEPVTGSHLGPNSLALFFWSDETVRSR
jgi:DegV family protein with EDD domain